MALSTASPSPEGILWYNTGGSARLTNKNASQHYGKDLWQNSREKAGKKIIYEEFP